jgi:hypothetical protein
MITENDTKGTDIQKWDYSIIWYKNDNIQIQNSIIRDFQQNMVTKRMTPKNCNQKFNVQ